LLPNLTNDDGPAQAQLPDHDLKKQGEVKKIHKKCWLNTRQQGGERGKLRRRRVLRFCTRLFEIGQPNDRNEANNHGTSASSAKSSLWRLTLVPTNFVSSTTS
jgi:hypothetical protein